MSNVEICRWDGLEPGPERDGRIAELDQVFFSSSATQSFPTDEAKAAFRERWLGRYLRHFPHYALLALDGSGRLIGYVIGSMEDPARDPLFDDLTFLTHFRTLTRRYPAHLHVNLDASWRNRGIGQRLVDAFAEEARAAGAPGLHVVTARGMRNVGFYARNGFLERGTATIEGRELLLLGRDLVANP